MKKILSILLIGIILIGVTGCGSSTGVSKELNKVVDVSVSEWKEKDYAHTFTMSDIQSNLGNDLVIIASGDKEFTKGVTNTSYTESIKDYSGSTYSNTRMLEKDMNVNHCLVLDKSSNKYYDVEIIYKTIDLNGSEKEYPYFQNDKEL